MRHYRFIVFFLFSFFMASCNSDDNIEKYGELETVSQSDLENEEIESVPEITSKNIIANLTEENDVDSFAIKNDNGTFDAFLVKDCYIHIVVPHTESLKNCKLLFPKGCEVILLKGYFPDYSDFTKTNSFKICDKNGNSQAYSIIIYDIPVISIETPDGLPILSSDYRTEGCQMNLYIEDGIKENIGLAGIKVRGNSTARLSKKPYNVKLDTKKSILGMKKSKKWVLLANAGFDRTQLHNATAFEVARLTDYDWVQSGSFIELILNGEHKGLYYLCEKIDIAKDRININELSSEDIDEDTITGGYLIEGDMTQEGYFFQTDYCNTSGSEKNSLFWHLKNPDEDVPAVQLDYIKHHMNLMESFVKKIIDEEYNNEREYLNYLDIESAINWYLIEELCCNEEASRTKNCYLYKKRGDNKIYFGPPWDFDAWSFGSIYKKKLYIKEYGYFWNILFQDEYFIIRLKEKWNNYKSLWITIPDFITEQYEYIYRAAKRNEVMYNNWTDWQNANRLDESYEQLVDYMKESFIEQLNYMDIMINAM